MHEHIFDIVREIIDTHTCLEEQPDGTYRGEVYADYRDELGDERIKSIFHSSNPHETLFEIIDEAFWGHASELEYEIYEVVEKHFDDWMDMGEKESEELRFEDHAEIIRDWLNAKIFFEYPTKHFLDQDVCMNFILDVGDCNFDFTLNNFFNFYRNDNPAMDDYEGSSLVWLMRQQGYSDTVIEDFILNYNTGNSKLLESIKEESENSFSSMNALVFMVKMSLEEAITLHEMLDKSRKSKSCNMVRLDKETACGLYDSWAGSGGVLNIQLERDVAIPLDLIFRFNPDAASGSGYSIRSIWGMDGSEWTDTYKGVA